MPARWRFSTYVVRSLTVMRLEGGELRRVFELETLHYDWKHYGQGDPDLHGRQHLDIGPDQA
ncbi:MAG: hypothetical protein ABEN55_02005 [Bradymonadaceae bacterium]